MTKMHNPPHPGLTLKEDVLKALGLNVMKASEQLGIPRVAFSRVIHGQAGVLPKWLCVLKLGWAKAMLAVQILGYPFKVKLI